MPARILPLLFLVFSPFLVWLGGYLLVSPFFREWEGWKKALLVSSPYVAIGAFLIPAAADARGFSGVPPFFPLIWPFGYVFLLFSDRLFEVSELHHLLWVGLGITLSLGLVSSGLLWFRHWKGDAGFRVEEGQPWRDFEVPLEVGIPPSFRAGGM